MYSPSNFGLSADILKVVSSVMEEGRRITKENLAEQVASGVWNIEGQSGSVVSVYDTSSRTRFKLEVLDELKMKNSDAALKLKKEISSLETSISKLTPLARKDDAANMKLVASKKRLEAKKAEHSKLMKEESYKTSAGATEAKVVQAVGQIKHFAKEMYKGDIKKAYNDWAGKTTFGPVLKAEVLKRAGGVNEATDPVDKKELTKSFEKRKDKDIDNDGDTDSSDEYLHKRRKAISKAMKEESDVDEGFINLGGAKVKDDEKSILQHIKKTFPNVKKVKKDSQHGWIPVFEAKMEAVELDEVSREDATKHHVKVGELVNLTNPKATPRHKVVKIQGDKIHIQKDGNGAIQVFPLERVKRVKAATYKHQQSNFGDSKINNKKAISESKEVNDIVALATRVVGNKAVAKQTGAMMNLKKLAGI